MMSGLQQYIAEYTVANLDVIQSDVRYIRKCIGMYGYTSIFSRHFTNGNKFCDFLFASLSLKAPITTAADDIHKYFFIVFQRK